MNNQLMSLVHQLTQIGISLSMEKDVNKLLDKILKESMSITNSDGGSLYVVSEESDKKELVFKIAKNFSREFPFKSFKLAIDRNSIAGYVAKEGKALNISNVLDVYEQIGVKYNSAFDKQINYKTVNMMVIPMKNFEGEIIGVLQLINKKENGNILGEPETITENIIPYDNEEMKIIEGLASQAGVLLERTTLYNEIEELLKSMIETMITTIETRDKTTSGHSKRIAGYAVEMLRAINRVDYGIYKELKFSEDEIKETYYAALLHDIGKIGISEAVLGKPFKVNAKAKELLMSNFNAYKYYLKYKELKGEIVEIEKENLKTVDLDAKFIEKMCTSFFSTDEDLKRLTDLSKIEFEDMFGEKIRLIEDSELEHLRISRGTLTGGERNEIMKHVSYTKDILNKISWAKNLERVPEIAGSHHEFADGSGYPAGLKKDGIMVQGRVLSILDIFEALTARDRPYKAPMPLEKAISILQDHVDKGHLDKELFEIFIKEEVFELYKKELSELVRFN